MRIAYLDCYAGIAGDMLLGALLDAGVPAQVLHDATAALALNASLRIETVDRSGISCTKVTVLEGEHLAEALPHQQAPRDAAYSAQPKTQHRHKTGHAHTHDHPHSHAETSEAHSHDHEHDHDHAHGRSLTVIRKLIEAAPLAAPVKQTAIRAFDLLGHAEAKIHNVPVDHIHFHEVGAVDAIVDIVAASAGIHRLGIGAWYSSAVNVGGGMVECAHGTFPVPAPATAELLRGAPTYSAHVQKELVTPTGAALLRALEPSFGPQPAMQVSAIGYGAGSRNPAGFPNALRLCIGEAATMTGDSSDSSNSGAALETVAVLETALDDLSPQLLAHVAETVLAQGALDAMLTPAIMKKGRPGTLLTVLCEPADATRLTALLLAETTTLGVRLRHDRRSVLARSSVPVATPYGEVRIKRGAANGEERNAAPEFEDCKAAAARHNVPVKQVQQAAIAAYLAGRPA